MKRVKCVTGWPSCGFPPPPPHVIVLLFSGVTATYEYDILYIIKASLGSCFVYPLTLCYVIGS